MSPLTRCGALPTSQQENSERCLAETLSAAGFEVLCLRGEGAGYPAPKTARVLPFSTNASLRRSCGKSLHSTCRWSFTLPRSVISWCTRSREALRRERFPARREFHLILRPAEKILPRLRRLFPEAVIVGWKYELDGSRSSSIAARTRANQSFGAPMPASSMARAYGDGFGFLARGSEDVSIWPTRSELCEFLAAWTLETLSPSQASAKVDQLLPCQAVRSARRRSPQ